MLVFFLKKIQKEKCKFLLAYFSGCAYTRLRYGGSSSVGRAPGCGPGGRGFKSHLSPHKEIPPLSSGVFLFLPPGCGLERGQRSRRWPWPGARARMSPAPFPCAGKDRHGQLLSFWEEGRSCPWPTAARCDRRPWGLPLQDGGPSLMEATALAASGRAALAKAGPFAYKTSHHGAWRSMVAHLLWEQGVAGSNPVAPTIKRSRGHTTMWCDLFLFCGPWRPCRRAFPQALGKARPIFPVGRSLRACLGRRGRGRAARPPTCKDRQGGCMGRQDRAPHPLSRTGSFAGAAVPTPDSPRRGERV